MNPLQFANTYLQPYKRKGNEIAARYCPYCKGNGKDKYTFYLNVDKQTFICHRGSCNKQGHFTELCRDFGEEPDNMKYEIYKPVKQYKKPQIKTSKLSQKAIKYAQLRKITEKTLEDWKVTEKNGNFVFNYYDENNELVFVKYRPARKIKKGERKAWREKDGKPILYGMWKVDKQYPLVICEGEFDALALSQAGVKNAVSVPSGNNDFTWIDLCWDWLQGIDKIIIFGDKDEPGKEMEKKLIAKLGEERCYTTENKYKDANELLFKEGPEAVRKAVENAQPVPLEGLIDLSTITPQDDSMLPKIKSNIKWLDKLIGGWILGELSIWTGKRGEGKSTFLGQVLLEALETGNSVCAYSGELTAQRFQNWIHLQAAGAENIQTKIDDYTGKEYQYISKSIHDKIREWYKGRFFLYDNSINFKNAGENSIIKVFTYAAKRYDCKLFLVDNLMTARFDGLSEKDYYRRQSEFVGELVRFAKAFNVHVHLVAHPKKTKEELDNDSVSGTSEITDRADNVFAVKRLEGKDIDTEIKILKNRSDGVRNKSLGFNFDEKSKRFWIPSEPGTRVKKYRWQDYETDELGIDKNCPF